MPAAPRRLYKVQGNGCSGAVRVWRNGSAEWRAIGLVFRVATAGAQRSLRTTSHVERTDNVSPISNSNSIRPAIVSRETSGERWGDVAETVPRRGDKESPAASFARHADTDHVAAGETSATPEQLTSDGRSPPQPELLARLSRTGLRPGASTIPARSLRRAHFLTAQLEGDHVSRETRRNAYPSLHTNSSGSRCRNRHDLPSMIRAE